MTTQSEFARVVTATARCCLRDALTVFALKNLGWSTRFSPTRIVGSRDTLDALNAFRDLESALMYKRGVVWSQTDPVMINVWARGNDARTREPPPVYTLAVYHDNFIT